MLIINKDSLTGETISEQEARVAGLILQALIDIHPKIWNKIRKNNSDLMQRLFKEA